MEPRRWIAPLLLPQGNPTWQCDQASSSNSSRNTGSSKTDVSCSNRNRNARKSGKKWEDIKAAFIALYVNEDWPLEDVIKELELMYGFIATSVPQVSFSPLHPRS